MPMRESLACEYSHGNGMPENIPGWYAAACHILKDGDTWIDGGCAEAHNTVAVRDHLRDTHHINVSVIGIDLIPTERLFRFLLRPEYTGAMDYDTMMEAAVRSRAALDSFMVGDIRDAEIPENSADVVTCFHLGGGPDNDRGAQARLAGLLREGGSAVFSVHRQNRAADIVHGNTRLDSMLRRHLLSGPLLPVRERWHAFCSRRRLDISVYGLLRPIVNRWRPLRHALRCVEIRVMTKAEALEHATACGPRCMHGRLVDFH